MPAANRFFEDGRAISVEFPQNDWFAALGRLMEAEGEIFRRTGYCETRFVVRVLPDREDEEQPRDVWIELNGYALSHAQSVGDIAQYDPDFIVCGRQAVWTRMLDEIQRGGHPESRRTLSSLALLGEELWLESTDQLREDKFYRYAQTLQEFFNLASKLNRANAGVRAD
jgi:hypothetical protein